MAPSGVVPPHCRVCGVTGRRFSSWSHFFIKYRFQPKELLIHVANSTRLPYLDVRCMFILMDSTPDGWFWPQIRICVRNNMHYWIRSRSQWVLPSLSVTLSSIISLLIYPAAFASSMLYHVLSCDAVSAPHAHRLRQLRSAAAMQSVAVSQSAVFDKDPS